MCFSAEASFGASAVLGVIGIASIRKTTRRKQVLFAAIPIFFAVQQFSEGFVWLSFTNPQFENYRSFAASVFLIFALLIWPVWMPLSIWLLEENSRLKKLLLAAVGFGLVFSVLLGFFLFSHTIFPEIKSHHIHYALGFSGGLVHSASLLYLIPTLIPPFLSSYKKVKLLGVVLFFSYLVSKFYFADAIVSVWCFLGAFISLIVFWTLKEMQDKAGLPSIKEVYIKD